MNRLTDEARWTGVLSRDPRLDGQFYYGVSTTKIYCRPSCPARRPLRKNVRFFESATAAVRDGFRPCKRCKPDTEENSVLDRLHRAAQFVLTHPQDSISLADLAEEAQMSPGHFQKAFKSTFGLTPKSLHEYCRNREFKKRLRDAKDITAAIYAAGYGSSSRVYEKVGAQFGMTPTAIRNGGDGESISFEFAKTRLGLVLLAATDRGLCFLQFGADRESLLAELKKEFGNAEFKAMPRSSKSDFEGWVESLNRFLDGKVVPLNLPLDIRGTAFQKIVWDFLQTIPAGETRTYSEVARQIGKPNAYRAVANACGKNRIAIAIPCHRVIRGNGELGGYRWGIERKQSLLTLEQ